MVVAANSALERPALASPRWKKRFLVAPSPARQIQVPKRHPQRGPADTVNQARFFGFERPSLKGFQEIAFSDLDCVLVGRTEFPTTWAAGGGGYRLANQELDRRHAPRRLLL